MARALVLNASLEPLSVVPVQRALVLVLADRADVIVSNGVVWHSEHITMASPSVVQLRRFVAVPYARRVPVNRRTVFHRDRDACQYCGRRAENLDHVIPRSRGGEHTWRNVVAACRRCNTRKGGRTPKEAGLQLRRNPRVPPRDSWIAAALGGMPDAEWAPYLKV